MALNPLHQFEIYEMAKLNVAGHEVAFTNQSFWMMAATLTVVVLFALGIRKKAMVPGRLQAFVELTFEFIQSLVKDIAGKEGLAYMPLILSIFLFIAFLNLFGMVPSAYSATSQIYMTAAMSFTVFAIVVVIGFWKHGIKFFGMFLPDGVPMFMAPFVVVLEIISFLARPFTLAIRLAANMVAGHVLLKIFASFVIMLGGALYAAASGFGDIPAMLGAVLGGAVPMFAVFAITVLETFVALLQAYIFTVLCCVYLNDSLHMH